MAYTLAEKLNRQAVPNQTAKVLATAIGGSETGAVTTANAYTDQKAGSAAALKGSFVCDGATPVTVANANLAAGDSVVITLSVVGGTVGATPAIKTRTNGTGFTVAGTASDTSTYLYRILKA